MLCRDLWKKEEFDQGWKSILEKYLHLLYHQVIFLFILSHNQLIYVTVSYSIYGSHLFVTMSFADAAVRCPFIIVLQPLDYIKTVYFCAVYYV